MNKQDKSEQKNINDLLEKIKKLEGEFVSRVADSKLDTQKKSKALRDIRKDIARAKTQLNEKIYEEAKNE